MASSFLEQRADLEENQTAMKQLAYYLLRSYRFQEAKKVLDKIIDLWGEDGVTLVNTGICYSELGNHELAALFFSKALSLESDNLSALLYLANSYLRLGNIIEAQKKYDQFIEKGGSGADAERVKKILAILKNEN